jgi:hypothetical protein
MIDNLDKFSSLLEIFIGFNAVFFGLKQFSDYFDDLIKRYFNALYRFEELFEDKLIKARWYESRQNKFDSIVPNVGNEHREPCMKLFKKFINSLSKTYIPDSFISEYFNFNSIDGKVRAVYFRKILFEKVSALSPYSSSWFQSFRMNLYRFNHNFPNFIRPVYICSTLFNITLLVVLAFSGLKAESPEMWSLITEFTIFLAILLSIIYVFYKLFVWFLRFSPFSYNFWLFNYFVFNIIAFLWAFSVKNWNFTPLSTTVPVWIFYCLIFFCASAPYICSIAFPLGRIIIVYVAVSTFYRSEYILAKYFELALDTIGCIDKKEMPPINPID